MHAVFRGDEMSVFQDRAEAGRKLADKLKEISGVEGSLVLALPRGGVPVAYEMAVALNLELDVFVVRKLKAPGYGENILGAIASGGIRVLYEAVIGKLEIPDSVIARVVAQEQQELQRQESLYRIDKAEHQLKDRSVIVVDDWVATGASIQAALAAVKSKKPAKIVAAVPVADYVACRALGSLADQLVTVVSIEDLGSIAGWYASFQPVTDEEVQRLLTRAEAIAGYPH
jgi:putative phosphoribosyl transferase